VRKEGKMEKGKMEEKMRGIPKELHGICDFSTAGMKPPHQVLFGFGAVDQTGDQGIKVARGKKALVVSDKILEEITIVDRVVSSLHSVGFSVDIFTDVEPEPHVETLEALYDRGAGREFSVIVGLGGGSVMDVAKLTAQCLGRRRTPREYLDKKVLADGPGIPLILIPTTSGTGSEVSYYLIVAVGEEKRVLFGPYYYADIAIVDPLLAVSMPSQVTASTGIDALTHAVEGMLSTKANPFTDAFCLAAVEKIAGYLRRAVADGEDLEARYYMAMAAMMSIMGANKAGLTYAHSVSYVVPRYKFTPHGTGCGLGLPYIMDYNLPVRAEKLGRIAAAMGEPTWRYSELEAARLAVRSVARLIRDVGLPVTLKEYGGVKEADLERMADEMITLFYRPLNPRHMGKKESAQYWRNMWHGTLLHSGRLVG
jgi:alcohol dehydrogenase